MKKRIFKINFVLLFLLVTEFVFAQTAPPNRTPPPGLPIDGGLFALVAVAFGYGINKLRSKK